MRCNKRKLGFSAILSVLITAQLLYSAVLAAVPELDKLTKACADCHGKNGISEDRKTPIIAGMSETYFVEALQAFVQNKRPARVVKRDGKPDTDMKKIVKNLQDNEIQALAKHYSNQKFLRTVQPFDPDMAKSGKKLHRKYCEKCHENAGRVKDDDAGILAGQKIEYLSEALQQFNEGKREMGKKMRKKMQALEKKHGSDGFKQLVHFYASEL
ncbi:MAG: c-type cytochrome [Gammaproteobacteria bacterium]|nr:c-type cytochrome [Gammaproteobacteria bacterium]